MAVLNYLQILVIFILYLNFILCSDSISHSTDESKIKTIQYRHHKIENLPSKFINQELRRVDSLDLNNQNTARHLDEDVDEFDNDSSESGSQISIPSASQNSWDKKTKPLRNIFMGIYKNYKSTYMGNKTSSVYRKSIQDGWLPGESSRFSKTYGTKLFATTPSSDNETISINNESENDNFQTELNGETTTSNYKTKDNLSKREKLKRKKKKKKKKDKGSIIVKKDEPLLYSFDGEYRYNIGPGVNISLDMKKDVVSVNLDEDCLKEILLGRWVDENEGRGKKYEMISKILPLFILPFLIQSAIIPFLVTKLKLLLIKSILVGKLAIFLLVISAIKNNQKVATYEPSPAYWAAEPSRRSEIYNGYRVEGRPTTWVQ